MFEDKTVAENLMNSLVNELIEVSHKGTADGQSDYQYVTLEKLERLKQLVPVWAIETERVNEEGIDRKANMFGGQPFTSDKHPWPLNESGSPYYPLAQIDLQQISDLQKMDFGSGLLQVWLDITDADLPHIIRLIDPADMDESLLLDIPTLESTTEIDEYGMWFGRSLYFSYKFLGYMLPPCYRDDIEWDLDRVLSESEEDVLGKIEQLSEENGYQSLTTNWLLGHPDRGSGSPAGRYEPVPMNLIQLAKSDVFPMADVSSYANIFYSDVDGDIDYFFDWNG
jgi:hypothetical protein